MIKISKNIKMSKRTTFRIGGRARFFAEPRNVDELIEVLRYADDNKLYKVFLGGGSNVLFPDYDMDCIVISSGKLDDVSYSNGILTAGAGVSIKTLNKYCIAHGLSGLEFSCGLPGSTGGAVYMNARCYGREFGDVVVNVYALDADLKRITYNHSMINYSYKRSAFMDDDNIFIYKIDFAVTESDRMNVKTLSYKNFYDRRDKGQYKYPSAGCAFKNDYSVGIPSGKLIDDAGLKGLTLGGAAVYEKHANFVINKSHATSADVQTLIENVISKVHSDKGITLEKEIKILNCVPKADL